MQPPPSIEKTIRERERERERNTLTHGLCADAGHYVPAFSARILQGNEAGEGIPINLKGSGIGDGLVDPEIQYGYYWQYARDHSLVNNASLGLMEAAVGTCKVCGV